ncbi:MAG TPA: enoyl-CoA hydratase/isomerase family protein [Acidimicrobiales bacterium]|nr:enoyl-CoA hydratase/isomerase family protein [Acidimicrobiales bacterium]
MTDGSERVRVAVDGAVRTVTLCRPEKRNALDAAMLAGLAAAFEGEPGPDERVAVLRAEGPVFCAGLDLAERRESWPERPSERDARAPAGESPIEDVLAAVDAWPLPVVAVVQGDAIAGGNELALHCDLVVASTRASFGMSLAQIGLAPTWYLAGKLLDVGGPVLARELLLLGEPVPATRLADLGVIARAVPPHELEATAGRFVERLAANAPLSLRAIKAVIRRGIDARSGIAHDDVDALVDAAGHSADAREGIAARLERRSPRFEGR